VKLDRQLCARQLAYPKELPESVALPVGARVIARLRDDFESEKDEDRHFYAGIVAEPPRHLNRYR